MSNDNRVEIQLIEMFNNDGNKITYQLLSRMEISKITYYLLTPFDEEEATGKKPIATGTSCEVLVMKEVEENNRKFLEPLNDTRLAQLVFDLFKQTNSDKYNFQN